MSEEKIQKLEKARLILNVVGGKPKTHIDWVKSFNVVHKVASII